MTRITRDDLLPLDRARIAALLRDLLIVRHNYQDSADDAPYTRYEAGMRRGVHLGPELDTIAAKVEDLIQWRLDDAKSQYQNPFADAPEAEFEVVCNDEEVARVSGPLEFSFNEAIRYGYQYASEGHTTVNEVIRRPVWRSAGAR